MEKIIASLGGLKSQITSIVFKACHAFVSQSVLDIH